MRTRLPDTPVGGSEASTPSSASALGAKTEGLGPAQDSSGGDKITSVVLPMDSPLPGGASNCPVVPCDTTMGLSLDRETRGGGEADHEEGVVRVVSPTIEEHRDEEDKEEEGSFGSEGVVVTAPSTPMAGGPDPAFVAAPTTSLRLHCRLCACEPCVDLTATMCGHVFCYKCIHYSQWPGYGC